VTTAAIAARTLPGEPTLSLPLARGVGFFALAGFGALHWMVLLEPAEPDRALYGLGAAALVVGGLLAAARLGSRARLAAAAAVAVVALALALLGGGVADELLRPDQWGALASGLVRGIESLPGIRVPYRGVDEWTRIAIGVGGTALPVLAAALAFWPRGSRTGFAIPALILLVALYVVPAVALDFENEFVRGAALALLVLAFLRLEKLRLGDAGNAGLVAAAAAVLALLLAPALDGDQPWWDYESWALGAASARSTSFSWDHEYGPLDWPRDGRELLRVKAERWPAYWKAANLDRFDGIRWREGGDRAVGAGKPDDVSLVRGTQRISVTVRNLTSSTFITAGYADEVDAPTVREVRRGDGTWAAGRELRRGDAYSASVYTPQTNEGQRRQLGFVENPDGADLAQFRRLVMRDQEDPTGQSVARELRFDVPQFGFPGEVDARPTARSVVPIEPDEVQTALEQGPYRRTWNLAQRLRAQAETQEDLVQSVLAYLREDFGYTEQPPQASSSLEGFLFDSKAGYCQHFSGAMALVLRMAGVPSRVVTGFTSGSLDRETREYVVRDLDAHSWVEVWYPSVGWVTFDPTPALAPPRAQPDEATGGGPGGTASAPPSLPGDLPSDPGRRALAEEAGTPWGWIAAGVAGGLALAAALVLLWRGRRRRAGTAPAAAALAELERALRRTRQQPGPGTTLRSLEQRFAPRSPAAAGYVRALSELRYGGRPLAPTPAQRRGLRAELARGNGLAGRLRAWWALPPRAK
jgi:protein-glutamine gamma-glutamyltransferase